jgi:hypothetical protein
MDRRLLPEAFVDEPLRACIQEASRSFGSLEEAEKTVLHSAVAPALVDNAQWLKLCELVRDTVRQQGYVVVRGLPADGGISLLIVSAGLGYGFDTYVEGQIVKRFRMSPWTKELSHTTRAGDFHTDGNVSSRPPVATAMQCEIEDPGAPDFAEQRVAFLPELLSRLSRGDAEDRQAFTFLTGADVCMAQERSHELWTGKLVQDDSIRYHPQSLRVAAKRLGLGNSGIESVIAAVHRAAIDISVPFHTAPGDTLIVSNRTALHYRGECSVRFIRFPSEFESRSLLVLHLSD